MTGTHEQNSTIPTNRKGVRKSKTAFFDQCARYRSLTRYLPLFDQSHSFAGRVVLVVEDRAFEPLPDSRVGHLGDSVGSIHQLDAGTERVGAEILGEAAELLIEESSAP